MSQPGDLTNLVPEQEILVTATILQVPRPPGHQLGAAPRPAITSALIDLPAVDAIGTSSRLAPDRHISLSTPGGAIVVSSQAVEKAHRNRNYRERTALTPLRGQCIGLKQSAIEYILGIELKRVIREMVKLGIVEEHPETKRGVGTFYRYDPAWTLRDLHDRWVAGATERTWDRRLIHRYRRVRALCDIPADDPVPAPMFLAAVALLADLGTTETAEINGYLPLGSKAVERCAEVRLALDERWRARWDGAGAPAIVRSAVLREFPELAGARDTSLLDGLEHERPGPPPEMLGRAWTLKALRRPLVLLLHVMAGKGARRSDMNAMIRAFEIVERLIRQTSTDAAANANDADVIERAVGTLAFGDPHEKMHASVREETARIFMVGVGWLRRWIKTSKDVRFESFNCAQMPDRQAFASQLQEVYSHLRKAGRAERLRRSAVAASRFVAIQEIAYMRKEGICDTAAVARRAVREMGDASCIKFSIVDRVMGQDGSLMSGAQRNDWIGWRRPANGADLPDVPDNPIFLGPPEPNRDVDEVADATMAEAESDDTIEEHHDLPDVDLDDYIFEFVGCSPIIGVDAFDPWYIACAEHATWSSPASLDPDLQEARHDLIKAWHLPTYPSTPAGLLRFGTSDSALARRAAASGRTIFPLGQFELAMRFAHLALRAIVESFCRSGEFRQMEHRLSLWPTKEGGGMAQFAFLAFRKVTDGQGRPTERDRYRVSEQTHDEAFELAEAVISRCHAAEGQLPDIDPPSSLEWKLKPGPYIFSWRGVHLQLASLLVFLRYLLANTGEQFGFHDFRFAGAKDAKLVGLPMIMLQEAMKHAFPDMTKYYAHLTPELVASRTEDDLARRRSEAARRASYRNAA